jgi:hypothetical protein
MRIIINTYYVFFFWFCGCFLSVVCFTRERMQIKTRQNFADNSHHIPMMMKGGAVADGVARPMAVNFRRNDAAATGLANAPEMTIRKNFPESWIYETFEDLGSVEGFAGFCVITESSLFCTFSFVPLKLVH